MKGALMKIENEQINKFKFHFTCSIGAILLLVVGAILHWVRPEWTLPIPTCTSLSL